MNNKRVVIGVISAIWIFAIYLNIDRYPTRRDCTGVADLYRDRGLFDAATAAAYTEECISAPNRRSRRDIVDRMNDDASMIASTRI